MHLRLPRAEAVSAGGPDRLNLPVYLFIISNKEIE